MGILIAPSLGDCLRSSPCHNELVGDVVPEFDERGSDDLDAFGQEFRHAADCVREEVRVVPVMLKVTRKIVILGSDGIHQYVEVCGEDEMGLS